MATRKAISRRTAADHQVVRSRSRARDELLQQRVHSERDEHEERDDERGPVAPARCGERACQPYSSFDDGKRQNNSNVCQRGAEGYVLKRAPDPGVTGRRIAADRSEAQDDRKNSRDEQSDANVTDPALPVRAP